MLGRGKYSHQKHELIERVAKAQVAIAGLPRVLPRGSRIVLIDMMAGDGTGVPTEQISLFDEERRGESLPTPGILIEKCVPILEQRGHQPTVILCERNRQNRAKLTARYGQRATILNNCRELGKLPSGRFDYALVIVDPNGPADMNVDILAHLSDAVAKADFVIVVNEIAIRRHHGLRPPEEQMHANVKGSAASRELYVWQLEPQSWLHHIGRQQILVCHHTFGANGMMGRILLATNFAQRPPANFDLVLDNDAGTAMAGAGAAPSSSSQSSALSS